MIFCLLTYCIQLFFCIFSKLERVWCFVFYVIASTQSKGTSVLHSKVVQPLLDSHKSETVPWSRQLDMKVFSVTEVSTGVFQLVCLCWSCIVFNLTGKRLDYARGSTAFTSLMLDPGQAGGSRDGNCLFTYKVEASFKKIWKLNERLWHDDKTYFFTFGW